MTGRHLILTLHITSNSVSKIKSYTSRISWYLQSFWYSVDDYCGTKFQYPIGECETTLVAVFLRVKTSLTCSSSPSCNGYLALAGEGKLDPHKNLLHHWVHSYILIPLPYGTSNYKMIVCNYPCIISSQKVVNVCFSIIITRIIISDASWCASCPLNCPTLWI